MDSRQPSTLNPFLDGLMYDASFSCYLSFRQVVAGRNVCYVVIVRHGILLSMRLPNVPKLHVYLKYIAAAGIIASLSRMMYRLYHPDLTTQLLQADVPVVIGAALGGALFQLGILAPRLLVLTITLLGMGGAWYAAIGAFPDPAHLIFLLASGMAMGIWRAKNFWDLF